MNTRLVLIVLPLFAFTTGAALAETVPIAGHSKDKVQGKCSGDGDTFWTQGKSGQTYGCMHADGSGIVCGGGKSDQKKTCDTFKVAPPPFPFPTRDGAEKPSR